MNSIVVEVAESAMVQAEEVQKTYNSLIASGLPVVAAERELKRVYPTHISTDVTLQKLDILVEKERSIRNLVMVQKACCKTGDSYMIGLHNGLSVALSVLTGEEPELLDLEKVEV